MRVLVTGGAGYIGSMLTNNLLKSGYRVTVIDNLMHDQGLFINQIVQHHNCNFLNCDVMNIPEDEIKKADIIFPLAALVGAPLCEKFPEEAKRVNTESIRWLLKRLSKSQRVIFPNTNSGYGISGTEACTEETQLNSISVYGKTKEEAEKIILEHENSIVLRLATLHGMSYRPRIDLLVNYFTYLAHFKRHIDVFEGNFRRNFIYIKDVVNIFTAFINPFNDIKTQVFNLGRNEDNMTKDGLLKIIQEVYPDVTISKINKEDPDKRDYLVSNDKLYKLGLIPCYSVKESIIELKDYFNNFFPYYQNKTMVEMVKNI